MAHTLYLDQDEIQLSNQNAVLNLVAKNGTTQKIPLTGIKKLVVKGNNTLTARLLAKLGALGIGLIALSGQQHHPTLMLPNTASDVQLRIQQILAFQHADITFALSQATINDKIQSQIQALTVHYAQQAKHRLVIQKTIAQLKAVQRKLGNAKQLNHCLGYEGAASRIYFKCLAHLVAPSYGFNHRNIRPPKDPFNVLLSLSYTLLTSEIALALHMKGFDPYIGYCHTPLVGRPSLACDLIEPLRAWVDAFCIQLCTSQTIRSTHFSQNAQRCILERAGRLNFYEAWEAHTEQRNTKINQQITWLINALKSQNHQQQ
jgi:CRISPR-associated protein Cas1